MLLGLMITLNPKEYSKKLGSGMRQNLCLGSRMSESMVRGNVERVQSASQASCDAP